MSLFFWINNKFYFHTSAPLLFNISHKATPKIITKQINKLRRHIGIDVALSKTKKAHFELLLFIIEKFIEKGSNNEKTKNRSINPKIKKEYRTIHAAIISYLVFILKGRKLIPGR